MTEDDTVRILKRRPFSEMRRMYNDFATATPGKPDVMKEIGFLKSHGWNYVEYLDNLIQVHESEN